MIKKLHTMQVKYDLETVYCESRRVMARYIAGFFHAVERNWAKENSRKVSPPGGSAVARTK